ncbi:MAG: ABC transporter permease, partial [Rhodothermaceae bacterium]|nr:ABC transporter permease [Rhodothermaceae bacterium]
MARGSFERTVALRYLWGAQGSRQGGSFLRFVTAVAIGGVALGTAALLLALAIVRGFSTEIGDKVVGFGQHVQVEHFVGDPIENAEALEARLAAFEGVERVVPAVIEFALLRARNRGGQAEIDGVLLWGTPEGGQPFIAESLTGGQFSFAPDSA